MVMGRPNKYKFNTMDIGKERLFITDNIWTVYNSAIHYAKGKGLMVHKKETSKGVKISFDKGGE